MVAVMAPWWSLKLPLGPTFGFVILGSAGKSGFFAATWFAGFFFKRRVTPAGSASCNLE
jgi:hypothetical protein